MRNRTFLFLLVFLLLARPAFAAEGAAVMEAKSGILITSVNGETPLPPASTTKIMTALLTLDLGADLEKDHRISAAAAAVGESSINLQAGEFLSLSELLTGALVHSGNDACYAVAEAVAGSEALFVHWMNMKAAAMGAYTAEFYNTNGLPDDRHVISAADMTRITAGAMAQPFFRDTVGKKYASLGEGEHYRYYKNTNKLLWQDERIVGVKTGTTDDAGPCLVAAMEEGAALFVSTVFHSADRYGESLALLNDAVDRYLLIHLLEQGEPCAAVNNTLLLAADDLMILLPKEETTGLRLRWEIYDSWGTLQLLDEDGEVLTGITLEKKTL